MHSARQGSLQAWLICLSAGLFFFYEFIQMNLMNVLAEPLLAEFATDILDISKLSAIHLYADAIFLIPAGLILDSFSTRKTLITTFLITIFGVALLGFSHSMWVAALSRFITGFGNAFCFLISLRLIAYWFSPKQMALVSGIVVTIAMFGGVLAQAPTDLLINHIGWRDAMFVNAGIGLIFLLLAAYFVVDYVPGSQKTTQRTSVVTIIRSLQSAAKNKQNWFAGTYTCLLNLPIMLLGALWGKAFLMSARNLSELHALNITAMIFFGTIVGSPILGWISDKLERRRQPMIISGFISILILIAITYVPNLASHHLYLLFFLLGFITSAQVIAYPLITESNSLALNSSAMAIASIIIMGGAGVMQNLSSILIQKCEALPNLDNPYYYAMIFLIGCFAVAILSSFFLKETYCKHQENV